MTKRNYFLLATLLAMDAAWASEPPAAELETVTVTARHVPEKADSLPFAVERTGARDIRNRRLADMETLLGQTAGVGIYSSGSPGMSSFKIRGVGSLNMVGMDDTSVILYQNGVPQPMYKLSGELLDISGVEILKGPQGTLFGRNSQAGVVNMKPNPPRKEFEGEIGAGIGTAGRMEADGVVNLPFGDEWAGRLAFRAARRDHAYREAETGKPLSHPVDLAGRASLRKMGGSDEILLFLESERRSGHVAGYSLLDGVPEVEGFGKSVKNKALSRSVSLNWTHKWNGFHLKSVTGWADSSLLYTTPFFGKRVNMRLTGRHHESRRTLTDDKTLWFQELHLASNEGAPFFWLLGANYYGDVRSLGMKDLWQADPGWSANPFNADINPRYRHSSFAVFGEITHPVLAKLDLTAGARWSRDHTKYENSWVAHADYSGEGPRERRVRDETGDNYLTGRLGLNWAVTEGTKLYANYSRGHKAGDYSDWDSGVIQGGPVSPYKSAVVDGTEIGAKTGFLKGRIRLDAALFHNRIRNDHVYVSADPAQYMVLTPENHDTRSRGAELSLDLRPIPNLGVKASFAYTDAVVTGKQENSRAPDIKIGNRIPDQPKLAYGVSVDYRGDLAPLFGQGRGYWTAYLGWRHVGDRPADAENRFFLKPHDQLDARVGIGKGGFELALWAENILNERKELYGQYVPPIPPEHGGTGKDAKIGAIGPGRSLGADLRWRF